MERYRTDRVVGRGGFGQAVLCARVADGKACIVKQVRVPRSSASDLRQAVNEATLLAKLSHPNIVGYWDSFLHGTPPDLLVCIVMDYADGGDLSGYLERQKGRLLDEELVLDWLVQMTLALNYIHDLNILHRDLKPKNVFLTRSGAIKLGDFGVAKVLESSVDMANTVAGTPIYMSPEIIQSRPYDSKTDMWGLGCILYEITSLGHAFEGANMEMLGTNVCEQDPSPISDRYSPGVRGLVGDLLKKDPEARPCTGDVLWLPFVTDKIGRFLSEAQKKDPFSNDGVTPRPQASSAAAPAPASQPGAGNLGALAWARENGHPWETCAKAAEGGHLEVLRWARESGCPWDWQTCAQAASEGHLGVLQWARANGCPWDMITCASAAMGGQLEALKWARTNGCPWDATTCDGAAQGGKLGVLQWARANGCPWNERTCVVAAYEGHLDVLQWAKANGCPWSEWTCRDAAGGGHLEALKWAKANGCPWHERTCCNAAFGGHLHVLKWARGNGCPWDVNTCAAAALGGHPGLLRWARENGAPWSIKTCANAAEGGHLDILQWARANGCPWDGTTCRDAAKRGHLEVVKWARRNGCPFHADTCAAAFHYGHLQVVEWARENGCPG